MRQKMTWVNWKNIFDFFEMRYFWRFFKHDAHAHGTNIDLFLCKKTVQNNVFFLSSKISLRVRTAGNSSLGILGAKIQISVTL